MTIKNIMICSCLVLSACALPESRVSSGASSPTLIVIGAPAGSTLYVDGLMMGEAGKYDGHPGVLAVREGVHQIEVRSGNAVVFREKALVSGGETHKVGVSPVTD